MALRGETIGRAYVKILADGTGLDSSIRKSMEDAEPAVEVAGREHEKAYSKAFNDQLAKDKNFEKSYRRNIDKAFGGMAARAKLLSGNIQRNIADAIGEGFDFGIDIPVGVSQDPNMERRAELIGQKAAANITAGLNAGMDPKSIDFPREIRRAILNISDDMEADWRRASQSIEQQNRTTTASIRRNFQSAAVTIRESQNAVRSLERELVEGERVVTRFWNKVGDTRNVNTLARLRKGIIGIGDGVGKAFGKGSRNDALNVIGGIMGGLVKIPATLLSVVGSFWKPVKASIDRITDAFNEGVTTSTKWAGAISQAIAEVVAMGPAAIAVAGMILLIAGSVGAVVATIASLAGAVTGLIATVGFGLVGALAGAAAALIPVAAAIGGVALAIHGIGGFDEIAKRLRPLKATFEDLSRVVARNAFANMAGNVDKLSVALDGLRPLARAVGIGLGRMFDGFVAGLNSPAFKLFRNALTQYLPDAMASVGRILTNLLAGLGGLFRSLITGFGGAKSIGQQFLDTIEKLTGRFAKWVNSAEGQNKMKQFFTDAWQAAKTLGTFITTGIGLIGRLLNAARPTGNTLFDDMTAKMEEWSAWLADPAHQDQIARWFGDAVKIAREVGGAIVRVGELIAALDTPANRKIGQVIFRVIQLHIEAATIAAEGLSWAFGKIHDAVNLVLQVMRPILVLFSKIPGHPFQDAAASAVKAIDKFDEVKVSVNNAKRAVDGVRKSKVDFNTAPAITKMGLVIRKLENGKRVVEQLDGHPVTPSTEKGVLKMQALYDKTLKADSAAGKLARKSVDINTKGAVNAVNAVTQAATEATRAVLGVDGLYVNVNTSSAQASLNQLSHTADVVNSKLTRGSASAMAGGGMVVGPTHALIGEAGPEAVVPLNRPLNQVDPAVRQLSAIAQGLTPLAAGAVTPSHVTNVGGITVITPTKNPVAVATETVNRLVGVGY